MLLYGLNTYLCFHFIGTGISKDAAENMVEKGGVYGVGIDGRYLNRVQNVNFDSHQTLLKNNTFGLENLKLEKDVLPGNYKNLLTCRISHLRESYISF